MHLGRWVDKEVIFSPGGGSLSDFDFRVLNFRVFQEIPWRPHPGEGPNEDRIFSDGPEDEDDESRAESDGEASRRSVDSDDVEGDGLGTSQASQASAHEEHEEHEEHDMDELQDSDGSHADLPQISERSHSSVSSIPVLSTPMMDMEG